MQGQHDLRFDARLVRAFAAEAGLVERENRDLRERPFEERADLRVAAAHRQADLVAVDAPLRFSEPIITCTELEAGSGSDAVQPGEPVVDALLPVEIVVEVRDTG